MYISNCIWSRSWESSLSLDNNWNVAQEYLLLLSCYVYASVGNGVILLWYNGNKHVNNFTKTKFIGIYEVDEIMWNVWVVSVLSLKWNRK